MIRLTRMELREVAGNQACIGLHLACDSPDARERVMGFVLRYQYEPPIASLHYRPEIPDIEGFGCCVEVVVARDVALLKLVVDGLVGLFGYKGKTVRTFDSYGRQTDIVA